MQPEISSYAKLKEKDLRDRTRNPYRNNYSVINNPYKKEHRPENEEEEERKHLTVSHQFDNYKLGKNKNQEWTSTITGLFDDTKSIKVLKQSIKCKGREDEPYEKEHLKSIKLDLLDKLGRKAEHVEIDEEVPSPKRKEYPDMLHSMQLIE